MESVLFYSFAAAALVAGLVVVLASSLLYSALALLTVFLSIAGLFVLNNADFLAVAQVMIYAVGLTLVMLFGLMFTGDEPFAASKGQTRRLWLFGLTGLALTVVLLIGVGAAGSLTGQEASLGVINELKTQGSTRMLGVLLMSNYLLPFELVSVLLLGAMIGAIVISKKTFTPQKTDSGVKFALADGREDAALNQQWRHDVGFPAAISTAALEKQLNQSAPVPSEQL